MTTTKEDEALDLALKENSILPGHQSEIRSYLNMLGQRDEATRLHSIRVGVLCAKSARELHELMDVDSKMMLWAGLLHDIGKTLVDPDLFTKVDAFTSEDFARMEPHVEYGWRMLRGVHLFTSHIMVRHHRYGPHPYPSELPALPPLLESKRKVIEDSGQLLAIVDFYDAITTRENSKFGGKMTASAKREKFRTAHSDAVPVLDVLESAGLLTF